MSSIHLKIAVFLILLILGTSTIFSGLFLYFALRGPRSGYYYGKEAWRQIHLFSAFATVAVLVLHLLLNRGALRSYYNIVKSS
jgi:hypothetical protein